METKPDELPLDRDNAYVAPHELVHRTRHKTVDVAPVKLAAEIDPRRRATIKVERAPRIDTASAERGGRRVPGWLLVGGALLAFGGAAFGLWSALRLARGTLVPSSGAAVASASGTPAAQLSASTAASAAQTALNGGAASANPTLSGSGTALNAPVAASAADSAPPSTAAGAESTATPSGVSSAKAPAPSAKRSPAPAKSGTLSGAMFGQGND